MAEQHQPSRQRHPTFDIIFYQMESRHTVPLIDKHVKVADFIAKSRLEGWHYGELQDLAELLERMVKLFQEYNRLDILSAMKHLLENCRLPFISDRASDVMVYGDRLPQLITVICTSVMGVADPGDVDEESDIGIKEAKVGLREVVAEIMSSISRWGQSDIIEREPSQETARQILAATGTANLRIISDAREVLVELVKAFRDEKDASSAVKMLTMFRDMAVFRPICAELINLGLPIAVLRLLRVNLHKAAEIFLVATELLGNLIELDPVDGARSCGTHDFFEVTSEILNELVGLSGVKNMICRNDMATILLLIIEHATDEVLSNLVSSGLMSLLLFWSKTVDGQGEYQRMKELTQSRTAKLKPLTDPLMVYDVDSLRAGRMGSVEDVQLRIILWRAVALAAGSNDACSEEADEFGFMGTCLTALDSAEVSGGSTEYATRLETAALTSISVMIDTDRGMRTAFALAGGVMVVLRYVQGLASELRRGCRSSFDVINNDRKTELLKKALNTLMIGRSMASILARAPIDNTSSAATQSKDPSI
ncbi:hypothetical protein FOL47_004206 [Perkinsus chesapeaki]|uniref:Uncharacterized protein n=1 Tax=Perkinsus chesapeaki TaxID=330153 RepID=A0A7J6M5A0_PERCH|nr:hypothetical protein FOL47_004206 [Perkinsus chesapeaki]